MINCMSCKWCREEPELVNARAVGICEHPDMHYKGRSVPLDFACKHYEESTIKNAYVRRGAVLEAMLQLKNAGRMPAAACYTICTAIYNVPTSKVRPLIFTEWGIKEWGRRYCTNCNFEPVSIHDDDTNWDMQCLSAYCPQCGAAMCKEEEYHET